MNVKRYPTRFVTYCPRCDRSFTSLESASDSLEMMEEHLSKHDDYEEDD